MRRSHIGELFQLLPFTDEIIAKRRTALVDKSWRAESVGEINFRN